MIVDGFLSCGFDLWGYWIGVVCGDICDVNGVVIFDYIGLWYWNGNVNELMGYLNWVLG